MILTNRAFAFKLIFISAKARFLTPIQASLIAPASPSDKGARAALKPIAARLFVLSVKELVEAFVLRAGFKILVVNFRKMDIKLVFAQQLRQQPFLPL